MADTPNTPRLLRLRDVIERTGLVRSTIYDRIAAGTFPVPVNLGGRLVAWRASDVTGWIESRPSARTESAP